MPGQLLGLSWGFPPTESTQPQCLDVLTGAWLAPGFRAGVAPHVPERVSACFRAAALGSLS